VFKDESTATRVIEQIVNNARHFDFATLAYCLMPDHLHAIVEATSERSDFTAFVKRFKQTTGFEYRKRFNHRLWQPGYYEHILRTDETTEAVVRYILENPIRAGLTSILGEYRFAGSDRYTIDALISA
jgi:REP element-mobilizing transposase RayT